MGGKMICEKCNDAEYKHRYHFGYVAIEGGSRWRRYWMLCSECLENAKITNENKQHPLWYAKNDNGKIKLERSGKTLWPVDGKGYCEELPRL